MLHTRTRTNADVRPGLSCNVQTSRKTDKDIRKRETQRRRDTETEREIKRDRGTRGGTEGEEKIGGRTESDGERE